MGQIRNKKKNLRLFWTGWKTKKKKERKKIPPQHSDLWVAAKAGLGEAGGTKCMRRKRVQVNDFQLPLKQLEEEKQMKLKSVEEGKL